MSIVHCNFIDQVHEQCSIWSDESVSEEPLMHMYDPFGSEPIHVDCFVDEIVDGQS